MSRKIITAQDIERLYFQGVKEIYIDCDTLLLPGAKDALKTAGIKIRQKDGREKYIKTIIQGICDEKNLDSTLRDKVTELVMEKLH